MRQLVWSAILGLLLPLGCSRPEDAHLSMVGGTFAQPGQYPSTVRLKEFACTASKIGPRHYLTAGHCVTVAYTTRLKPESAVGATLTVQSGVEPAAMAEFPLTIKSVHVHPTMLSLMEWSTTTISPINFRVGDVDSAVFVVQEESALPVAKLAQTAPQIGDVLEVTGYGATDILKLPTGHLRFIKKKVTSLEPTFVVTLPQETATLRTGPSSGDSGGPAYRRLADQSLEVIATVSHTRADWSMADLMGPSMYTRIDPQAGTPAMGEWLQVILKE